MRDLSSRLCRTNRLSRSGGSAAVIQMVCVGIWRTYAPSFSMLFRFVAVMVRWHGEVALADHRPIQSLSRLEPLGILEKGRGAGCLVGHDHQSRRLPLAWLPHNGPDAGLAKPIKHVSSKRHRGQDHDSRSSAFQRCAHYRDQRLPGTRSEYNLCFAA